MLHGSLSEKLELDPNFFRGRLELLRTDEGNSPKSPQNLKRSKQVLQPALKNSAVSFAPRWAASCATHFVELEELPPIPDASKCSAPTLIG